MCDCRADERVQILSEADQILTRLAFAGVVGLMGGLRVQGAVGKLIGALAAEGVGVGDGAVWANPTPGVATAAPRARNPRALISTS
jgi:hypothetical protein